MRTRVKPAVATEEGTRLGKGARAIDNLELTEIQKMLKQKKRGKWSDARYAEAFLQYKAFLKFSLIHFYFIRPTKTKPTKDALLLWELHSKDEHYEKHCRVIFHKEFPFDKNGF